MVAAASRDVQTDIEPKETTSSYLEMLAKVNTMPYVLQAVAFWAVETVYNQAWKIPESSVKYKEYANRWGNSAFTEYCLSLENQANVVLNSASDTEKYAASDIVKEIAELEIQFWDMAFS